MLAISLLALAQPLVEQPTANAIAVVPAWSPATSPTASVQDLHREYHNIFRHGNRNAASHLWVTFLLQRAPQMTWERLMLFFSGFCAISGSPVRPSDYHRYRMTLPSVTGVDVTGFFYYCCWPCVCDTNDFIRIDTLNVTTSDGLSRRVHAAVIGNPCLRPEALRAPFVQPFYGRGETTLEREAPEVRCHDGELVGATLSDHGHIVIQLFPLAEGERGLAAAEGNSERAQALITQQHQQPQPGRIHTEDVSGLRFQDEFEYVEECAARERNGFNSGMGEIFRKVAAISPVPIVPPSALAPSALALGHEAGEAGDCLESEGAVEANESAMQGAATTQQ